MKSSQLIQTFLKLSFQCSLIKFQKIKLYFTYFVIFSHKKILVIHLYSLVHLYLYSSFRLIYSDQVYISITMSVFDLWSIKSFVNLNQSHFADYGFFVCCSMLFFDFTKVKLFDSILRYFIRSLASCLELFYRSQNLFLFLRFPAFFFFKYFKYLF